MGDNTIWLQPEQLSMLMLPELRRTILVLRKIGGEIVQLDKIHRKHNENGSGNYTISKIEPDLKSVTFSGDFTIPIDQIRSIYRRRNGWRIAYVSGF